MVLLTSIKNQREAVLEGAEPGLIETRTEFCEFLIQQSAKDYGISIPPLEKVRNICSWTRPEGYL